MSPSAGRKERPFDRPGNYRIRVQGFLDESWSENLGGLSITTSSREAQGAVTTLVGRLRDQAELFGVLHTLYELHLSILSVECLKGKEANPIDHGKI
jgi:hypothetical protein